jgi:prepilin-type N-terminal cleavage/methylation domain-containing protein
MGHCKARNGFSLIELLIVFSIILILAALAIPSLVRSKISANEASAVASLKTLTTALNAYAPAYGTGFPAKLSYLGSGAKVTSKTSGFIDSLLASGTKSGYVFTYVAGAPSAGMISSYTIAAKPQTLNQTGIHYFFTDQTGVIRENLGKAATATSPPIH